MERLYNSLPAVYRRRDAELGGPLRALLAVMDGEFRAFEEDLKRLHDNWFIETCEEWAVPYIGDLLEVKGLHPGSPGIFSLRPFIANILAHRRRKGTAVSLEQLARDVSGWNSRATEFFELLAWTQHMNHVRRDRGGTADLRRSATGDLVNTPFDESAHTVEVRRVSSGGRYDIPNVGVFLWPLQSYRLTNVEPCRIEPGGNEPDGNVEKEGRYTFSPRGRDMRLFNVPRTETDIRHFAEEHNVPGPLRRRALFEETENIRLASIRGESFRSVYFARDNPVLTVEYVLDGTRRTVPPEEMLIADLSDWKRPASTKSYNVRQGDEVVSLEKTIQVAVDPELGRLAFAVQSDPSQKTDPVQETDQAQKIAQGFDPTDVTVSYARAFSSDLGGGPYNRAESVFAAMPEKINWGYIVEKPAGGVNGANNPLVEALNAWHSRPGAHAAQGDPPAGVICIRDSRSYSMKSTKTKAAETKNAETKTARIKSKGITKSEECEEIKIPAEGFLMIVAADWPGCDAGEQTLPAGGLNPRAVLVPEGRRPYIRGDISVMGADLETDTPGALVLDGLFIEGRLTIAAGNLGRLRIAHSNIRGLTISCGGTAGNKTDKTADKKTDVKAGNKTADETKNDKTEDNRNLAITLDRCIAGDIDAGDSPASLELRDTIVQSYDASAIALNAEKCAVGIRNCTIFGQGRALRLQAENSIFTGPIIVKRRQEGCVRYCHLPEGALTPRRFRCQPDFALTGKTLDKDELKLTLARLRPVFASRDADDPAYGRLSECCPEEIRAGAEDGAEMGAFFHLKQHQRETNLHVSLADFIRFGRELGVFFVLPAAEKY